MLPTYFAVYKISGQKLLVRRKNINLGGHLILVYENSQLIVYQQQELGG
jgi:hypothetical protein